MSFLKNNWHWILFSLVIFGGIGVVLFTQLTTDTEPETVYKLPSEETLQNIQEKLAAQKAQEADGTKRPPPPGETHETGHWHGDHWHRTAPVETQTPRELSKEEIAKLYTKEEREYWESQGLNPPPPGYFYHKDENGVPKLYAENQPHFRLTGWTEGYGNTTLLSDEEWERYKALIPIADQTRLVLKEGMGTRDTTMFPDDVAALAREWKNELWKKTKSPRPTFSSFAQYTRPETPEDREREIQLLNELHDTLVPPETRPSHADHVLIKSILNELKIELRRR